MTDVLGYLEHPRDVTRQKSPAGSLPRVDRTNPKAANGNTLQDWCGQMDLDTAATAE